MGDTLAWRVASDEVIVWRSSKDRFSLENLELVILEIKADCRLGLTVSCRYQRKFLGK